jgi:glycosyltransferase involved in cell wall biosynthesis
LIRNKPISVLAAGPLPFLGNGARTFDFGVSVLNACVLPGLAELGHRVRVIAEAPSARGSAKRTGLDWGVPNLAVEWFALEYRSGSTPPPASWLATARARTKPLFERLVEQERPDVVLIGREDLAYHFVDLCLQAGLPSILIAHGVPTAALLEGIYSEQATQEFVDCLRKVTAIVTVANHLAEVLKTFGLQRVHTIPNLIDPRRFCPQPKSRSLLEDLRLPADHTVVSYVSALKQGKRPFDVVESAEIVLRSDPHVVYVIVGNGPLRREMETLTRSKGIAAGFRFVGEIAHERVPEYLNLADVVLATSEREGFPFIYREAQACGRTLLASDIAASREMIADGETGVLFRTGDVEDLAARTLALAHAPGLRRQIGDNARAVAAQDDPERWVKSYAELLSQTVAAHSMPTRIAGGA